MKELSLTPLEKAVHQLDLALKEPKTPISRDASIQRFEYTFELCWKMLKRYIKLNSGLEIHNIKDLFREAHKQNIIENTTNWFTYLEARNLTSHTYNEDTADETYEKAKLFLTDAKSLLSTLQSLT